MSLEWNASSVGSVLSKPFLRKVLANFRGRKDAVVRFGITGTGVQPNYQIEYRPEGDKPSKTLAFRGSTHKPYGINEPFNEERISAPFEFAEIERAYAERAPQPSGRLQKGQN